MGHTFNDELFDSMLRHQIGILRFSGSVRNKIWALLDATEDDLKKEIALHASRSGLDTPRRLANLNVMLEALKATRDVGWREARKVWFEEMRGLASAEPKFFDRIIKAAIPVELTTTIPSAQALNNIVTSQPFMGKTLSEWARNVRAADISRIEDQIKIGLVQGESPVELSRRIVGTARLRGRDGVTQITRRNAAAISRTVTAGIGSEARDKYLQENKDLLPQKLFTATLDSRTTPICQRFDGSLWDVDDPEAPVFPLHFGERSVYSPVADGVIVGDRPQREFTQRQLLREFADKKGIKVVGKRVDLPRGTKGAFDKFARKRMRELTGQVPAKTTYQEFLKRQSAANQDDILGPTRGALFRRGGLTLDKFVEVNGRELSLKELAGRHSEAFLGAGLDPADFR